MRFESVISFSRNLSALSKTVFGNSYKMSLVLFLEQKFRRKTVKTSEFDKTFVCNEILYTKFRIDIYR